MTEVMTSRIEKQQVRTDDGRIEEVWPLPRDAEFLEGVFRYLFEERYHDFSFGPLIPGAAYELRAPGPPQSVTMSGGYLTVHWGEKGHFHLCIGEPPGPAGNPNPPEVRAHRQPARVELYRRLDKNDLPLSWGLRMFNGHDEPQITVIFPNPYVTRFDKVTDEPDWGRLSLWEDFLPRFTGNEPDGRDRLGRGFGQM